MPNSQNLEAVSRRQAGVVTRAQLRAVGIGRHLVARRADAKVWTLMGPRVVVLNTGILTRQQQWWAAVLHAEPPHVGAPRDTPAVALCGLSAVEAGGLVGFEMPAVHVLVTHGREVGNLDSPRLRVRVHQTRRLDVGDVHPTLTPTRLRLPRAVVDSASVAAGERPGRARALIAAAVQQRLVRPSDLVACVDARRNLPGRLLIAETINDARGGAHSLPEIQFVHGLRAAGLPTPTSQRRLRRSDGTWYLDNDFSDWLVTVEVNGLQHYELLLKEADDFRRTVLQVSGRIVVDLSSYAVRHQIRTCMLLVAEVLQSHGWRAGAKATTVLGQYRDELGWVDGQLRAS